MHWNSILWRDSMICSKKTWYPRHMSPIWLLHYFNYFSKLISFCLPMLYRCIWTCIRYTFWFLRKLRHRLGSQDVEPLSVDMFVPMLFTFGVKHVLGLNLPVVFELCLRLSFIVTDKRWARCRSFNRSVQLTHVTHLTNLFCCLVRFMILKL